MLSKILRQLLDERSLSVTALAKKTSVPKSNIQGWLDGSSPNLEQLDKVAQYFDVSLEYLAFGREQPDQLASLIEKFVVHSGLYEVSISKVLPKKKKRGD